MLKKHVIKLVFVLILFQFVGVLLGHLTQENIPLWYNLLQKSMLTPPGFIFAIVWSFLYGLLAVIAWMMFCVYSSLCLQSKRLFVVQMLMNWCWTPLFFMLHQISFSAIWLVILTCLNGVLLMQFYKIKRILAYLLFPYFLWLLFASYLNITLVFLN